LWLQKGKIKYIANNSDIRIYKGFVYDNEAFFVAYKCILARKEENLEDLKIVNADNLLYTSLDETEFIIEDILPIGLHIFCGAPKVGKSWLMLDICIKVSKGEEIWNLKTNKCDVLYLALEDTYQRLQKRLFKLTNEIDSNFHISIESNKIANGLTSQLEQTLKKYPNIKLIVIDTLQKVRKQNNDINYSND
jgi:RecA-family ATPase